MTQGSPDERERQALKRAADAFAEHGIEFSFPWECDLDDLERERFEALVAACRAYAKQSAIRYYGDIEGR